MAKEKSGKLNAYVLLDRTGSMAIRWEEALSAVNTYVKEVGKKTPTTKFTVACFDHFEKLCFDVLRDGVSIEKWKPITDEDAVPRGGTPLYDALARAVGLAEKAGKKRTSIVVMTDGMENSSKETSQAAAKSMLDRCQKRGWDIVFLGADFDAFAQASMVGVSMGSTMNTQAGSYGAAAKVTATRSARFAASGQAVDFSDEDREKAVS